MNEFGPGHYPNTGEVTTRPTPLATSKPADCWFRNCDAQGNGGTLYDDQFMNFLVATLRQSVRTAGATQGELIETMLAEAMGRYASGAHFAADSGAANAYVLATTLLFVLPKGYFHGMRLLWRPANTNTGASVVNVTGGAGALLGSKKVLSPAGAALAGGELVAGKLVDMIYDAAADSGTGAFRMAEWAVPAAGGSVPIFPGAQSGQILSRAGTQTIGISAGAVIDSTATAAIVLASAWTKNVASAWAAGTGAGSLDTGGSLGASTWYDVYSIAKADGTADVLTCLGGATPVLPSGYTKKRLRGSFFSDASAQVRPFVQSDDWFEWLEYTNDVLDLSPSLVATTLRTLVVPVGRRVIWRGLAGCTGDGNTNGHFMTITPPDFPDHVVSVPVSEPPGLPAPNNLTLGIREHADDGESVYSQVQCLTNTLAQLRTGYNKYSTLNSGFFTMITHGWIDRRF